MPSTPKKQSIKGPVFPPQPREVNHGTRDIDPCPIINIKIFCSFECSRCQEGLKGNRAMGAYISNKSVRHTLLPLYNMTLPLSLLRLRNVDNVTRDIDPGIIHTIHLHNYTAFRHTFLPIYELCLFLPTEQVTSTPGTFRPASNRTINGKSHN